MAEETSSQALPRPPPCRNNLRSTHPVHKTLASAGNLANLLPTGTVLAFKALAPSFSNKGSCQISNKYLTVSLTGFCAIICFLSSFTDSFPDAYDGRLYYGIATFKGFYIFNCDAVEENIGDDHEDWSKFKIGMMDFVHAFVSLFVFLVFAMSDSDVQSCIFPDAGTNVDTLIMNLPLAAGAMASFLFMLFPTTRHGIGYSDTQTALVSSKRLALGCPPH